MLNQLKAALDLRKELPDAVGYFIYGPFSYPLPTELTAQMSDDVSRQLAHIRILRFEIDNYSSKAQRTIRVLFSGTWAYQPRIFFRRRNVSVKFEIIDEEKEIVFSEIPPNESVVLEIFNPEDEFKIEQVLIGDLQVTPLMQKRAQHMRDPSLLKLNLFLGVVIAIMACSVGSTIYWAWKNAAESRVIEEAHREFSSCIPYVYVNEPGKEEELARKYLVIDPPFKNYVLQLNKVQSFDELKHKDQLILCKRRSD